MKKIVPFNNVLTFSTDVREITAISLEHDINTSSDAISGTFYITGEYKITDGQLEKDKFSFDLPFDIALGCNYDLDTLVIDIDDFRYELIDNNKLKVNIDLYIDGKEITNKEQDLFTEEEIRNLNDNTPITSSTIEKDNPTPSVEEPSKREITESLDIIDEMLNDNKEENMEENNKDINIESNNDNENINIFNGFNEEEQYVTYHVYPFTETDTLDKVLTKYNITKEELAKYNNLDDIHTGDKLIIPDSKNDK